MKKERLETSARLLRIVAHPTRLMILEALGDGTRCVNDMRDILEVPQPNVSQHLAVLKESGMVACDKEGVTRCYRLAEPAFTKELLAVLKRVPRKKPAPKGERGRKKAGGVS